MKRIVGMLLLSVCLLNIAPVNALDTTFNSISDNSDSISKGTTYFMVFGGTGALAGATIVLATSGAMIAMPLFAAGSIGIVLGLGTYSAIGEYDQNVQETKVPLNLNRLKKDLVSIMIEQDEQEFITEVIKERFEEIRRRYPKEMGHFSDKELAQYLLGHVAKL